MRTEGAQGEIADILERKKWCIEMLMDPSNHSEIGLLSCVDEPKVDLSIILT